MIVIPDILAQVPTPAPTDLVTFQWVAIVALVGVVGFLYRQNVMLQNKNVELLEKVLEGLGSTRATIDTLVKKDESQAMLADIKAQVDRLSK